MGHAVLFILAITNMANYETKGTIDYQTLSVDNHYTVESCMAKAAEINKSMTLQVGNVSALCAPMLFDADTGKLLVPTHS